MLKPIVVVFLASCGGDPDLAPDAATPDASPDTPAGRKVTGTSTVRHVTESGEIRVASDLSSTAISAVVPPDSTVYPGVGEADGTFAIPGVPEGTYYLRMGATYLVATADTIDLGFDVLGRPDIEVATSATPLTFSVSNLQSWQDKGELQMFSAQSGTMAFALESKATAGVPVAGATSLAGFTFDLSGTEYRALIDGSAGDTVTVTQLASAGSDLRVVTRSFTPPSFTIANGGSATLSGAFTAPASATLDVTWNRPAFDAELRARMPGIAAETFSILATSALPEAATRGTYHPAPDLAVFERGYLDDATSLATGWTYGDPYPAAWTRTATARYFAFRYIDVAGTFVPIFASMDLDVDRATLQPTATLDPLIGAVVDPKINGNDAFTAQIGIGETPTLTWSAPTIGTPAGYRVLVARIVGDQARPFAAIQTVDTSVTIPAGILVAGTSYVFQIVAVAMPNTDLAAKPFTTSLPSAIAQITTLNATP